MFAEMWATFREFRTLRRASLLRIRAAEGIGFPLVWRIRYEQ
jgi:hypothetical protein